MGEFGWAYVKGALTASGPTGSLQFKDDANDDGDAGLTGSANLIFVTGTTIDDPNGPYALRLTGTLDIRDGQLNVFNGNSYLEGDVTVEGNLTVTGDTTTISSSTYIVQDPLIGLGFGTASAHTGAAGDRGFVLGIKDDLNQALFWDNSSGSFIAGKVAGQSPTSLALDLPEGNLSTLKVGQLLVSGTWSNDSLIGAGHGAIHGYSITTSGRLRTSGSVLIKETLEVNQDIRITGSFSGATGPNIFVGQVSVADNLLVTGSIKTDLGTISGSRGIFSGVGGVQSFGNVKTSGSVEAEVDVLAEVGTISGSKGIFTSGLTSSGEILATASIRTNLGSISGANVIASSHVLAQYGAFSGATGIFTGPGIQSVGNIKTSSSFSGSNAVFTSLVQAAGPVHISGGVLIGHGLAPVAANFSQVTGAIYLTSSQASKISGSISSSGEIFAYSIRTSGDLAVSGNVTSANLVDKSGTPADNQVTVWTDADTVEGSANLTFDGDELRVVGRITGSSVKAETNVEATGSVVGKGGFSGSSAIFTGDVQMADDLSITGTINGSQILAVDLFSGSTAIFTDDVQMADNLSVSGTVVAITGFSGSTAIFTDDVILADDLHVSGTVLLGHGENAATTATLHHQVTGALYVTSSQASKFSGSLSSSGEVYAFSGLRTSGDVAVSGNITVGQYIEHVGDSNTKIEFTDDEIVLTAGGREFIKMTEASSDTIEFNRLQGNNFNFIVNASSMEMLSVTNAGMVINEEGMPAGDLRMETNRKQRAIYVDSDLEFVNILVDLDHVPHQTGSDTALFVSGAFDSIDTGVQGTSVFGGDVVLSGSTRIGRGLAPIAASHHQVTGALYVTSSQANKFSGSVSSSGEVYAFSGLRTSGDVVSSGSMQTVLGTFSGSKAIFSGPGGLQSVGDIKTTGSFSGSKGYFTKLDISIQAAGDIQSSGAVVGIEGFSGSTAIFTGDVQMADDLSVTGTINASQIFATNGFSGSTAIFTDDVIMADDLHVSGTVLLGHGENAATTAGLHHQVTGAIYLTSSGPSQISGALEIVSNATTTPAVDVRGYSVTTAALLALSASALTTGKVIEMDINDASTAAAGPTGILIDLDKTGAKGFGTVSQYVALSIDALDTATDNAGAVVTKKGIDVRLVTDNATGVHTNLGIDISGSGGDANIGLRTTMDDAAGSPDIVMSSSVNNNDYAAISVGTNGVFRIDTVDESAALAHVIINADGVISGSAANGAGSFFIQATGSHFEGGGIGVHTVGGTIATGSLGINAHFNPTSLKVSTGGGEVITFGTEDGSDELAAGKLMCMQDDGVWNFADADVVASSSALIGVALGGTVADGILVRGYFHFSAVEGTFAKGQPCYISEAAGSVDFTAPSSAGDVVRVVGYATDVANVIYICPDNTWVEL